MGRGGEGGAGWHDVTYDCSVVLWSHLVSMLDDGLSLDGYVIDRGRVDTTVILDADNARLLIEDEGSVAATDSRELNADVAVLVAAYEEGRLVLLPVEGCAITARALYHGDLPDKVHGRLKGESESGGNEGVST